MLSPERFVMDSERESRKSYKEGQENQLGALGLVTNAVILWNTIYMQASLDHLRNQGYPIQDEDIAHHCQ